MKTIEIVIDKKGSTRLETNGFSGSDCREASRQLISSLGVVATEFCKAEFHSGTTQQSQQLHRD